MSKQSVEQILKDVIEASNAKTVALTEQLQKLAGDRDTYTERMRKMEENLTSAMQKVLEMDASIKDFHKAFGSKVDEMENKFASWWKNNEEDMDKPENWEDMTEDEQEEWIESNAKKEVAKAAKKAENVIDGINPKVVKGQPNPTEEEEETEEEASQTQYKAGKKGKKGEMPQFIKDKIEEREESEEEAYDEELPVKFPPVDTHNAKGKAKKAGKLKIEHEGEVEIENESEEGEEEEAPTAKKAKKAMKDGENIEDGEEIGNAPPVNQKYEEEKDEEACDYEKPKGKKGKKADESEAPALVAAETAAPAPVADVTKLVESVSGKIEAAYEKLATSVMKQAQAETKATEGEAALAALRAKAEQEASEKQAALEAAKTLALEVKARDEAVLAVKALEAKLAEMMSKVAQMEAADKSVEMKAAKVVASTGLVEPVSSGPVEDVEQTEESIMKTFESLQGKEQRAFYLANKQVIERVAFRGNKNRFR